MTEWHEMTALALGAEIEQGSIDPRDLAACFAERIAQADPDSRIFARLTPRRMAAEAEAARDRQRRGLRRSPLDGVPVSWKDLFDMAGEVTGAGSALLDGNIAGRDAPAVARLTRAGLVSLGKTTMSEFAFSGLGVNPLRGTPPYPFDAERDRAPGGSSSGAAVSVATGLAPLAVGTDTGGSVRIPAAWNGLSGLKTSAGRIPTAGVAPLSRVYDSIGPLTRTVADAAALFAVLARVRVPDLRGARPAGLQCIVPSNPPVSTVEGAVEAAFEKALERMARAGAVIRRQEVPALERTHGLLEELGNPVTADAQAVWGDLVRTAPHRVFAPIRTRIAEGEGMSAEAYARLRFGLRDTGRALLDAMKGADALLMPTVSIRPPPLADLITDPAAHASANQAALRLTRLANFLDLTALTVPFGHVSGSATEPSFPMGIMFMCPGRCEERLLRIAAAIEPLAD